MQGMNQEQEMERMARNRFWAQSMGVGSESDLWVGVAALPDSWLYTRALQNKRPISLVELIQIYEFEKQEYISQCQRRKVTY